jgi:WD40 repeat protein
MKTFKSGKWKLQALLILIAITLSFFDTDTDELFTFFQYREKYCSHDAVKSPYCNLRVVSTLEGHPTVSAIAISADGQTLVSGGQDKTIKVWELQTAELEAILDKQQMSRFVVSPDGKLLVGITSDSDNGSTRRIQVLQRP